MGIEKIVSDEIVFEIAEQLAANGAKVTNRAVWSAIGGGSMTTISQALRRWKENQELQVTQPIERTPLPIALVDVLHHAAAQLWEAAQAETKAELEQLAQATNARIAEAHSEREEALTELQTTAEELEQTKKELNDFQTEYDALCRYWELVRADINAQTVATTEANHRADTAEAARMELLKLTSLLETQAKATASELKAIRADLEKVKKEKATLDGMLMVYESIGKQPEAEVKTETAKKALRKPAKAKKADAEK